MKRDRVLDVLNMMYDENCNAKYANYNFVAGFAFNRGVKLDLDEVEMVSAYYGEINCPTGRIKPNKFTPGPWVVSKENVDIPLFDVRLKGDETSDDTLICQMYETGGPVGTQKANARLIAAAPELLEALVLYKPEHLFSKRSEALAYQNDWLANVKRVIAKATGGAS